ncbi:hypothetical protein SCITRI_00822 [Spiroplasma citri]|nr:hypothetical protein SCITRI_00822 [Spiroplasma citri]
MLKTNLGKLINDDALSFIIITKIIPIKAYTDIIIKWKIFIISTQYWKINKRT